jgi:MFS family permease
MKQHLNNPDVALLKDSRAIALLLAATLIIMANATISPALSGLARLFAAEPGAAFLVRLMVPAPSLTVVLFAPVAGLIVDRHGRRGLLLTGVALFVVTGSAGFYLTDLKTMLASRLALGVAVAMIMTAQTALVGDYFSGEKRRAMTGLQISARNFGGFMFISLAGWLAAYSPHLPFILYALAAIYLPYLWFSIAEPRRQRRSPQSDALAAGDERPRWMLRMAGLSLLQMITNMIFFVMPTQLPFFLETKGIESASGTGLALGALTLMGGFAALAYTRIYNLVGYAGAYTFGYLLMALGFVGLPYAGSLSAIVAAATMIGIGLAVVMPNFVAIALTLAPENRRGIAGGVLTTSVFLGQFFSPFVSMPSITFLGFSGTYNAIALLLALLSIGAVLMKAVTWVDGMMRHR